MGDYEKLIHKHTDSSKTDITARIMKEAKLELEQQEREKEEKKK